MVAHSPGTFGSKPGVLCVSLSVLHALSLVYYAPIAYNSRLNFEFVPAEYKDCHPFPAPFQGRCKPETHVNPHPMQV